MANEWIRKKLTEQRAELDRQLQEKVAREKEIEANDGKEFIDIEPTCILHSDPQIHLLLFEMSSARFGIRYSEWQINRLKKKTELSQYEQLKLTMFPERLKQEIEAYRILEAKLAALKARDKSETPDK